MKCVNCGFELDEHANFCSKCGTPVQRTPEPAETETPVTAEPTPQKEGVRDAWEMETSMADAYEDELEQEDDPADNGREQTTYAQLEDDDDEDYDDFAYQERRAKRQARKAKKARDKVILFVLVGVILVGALAFVIVKSLSGGGENKNSQVSKTSSVVSSKVVPSSSVVPESVAETTDPNKLSAEEMTAAVDTIQQQYEAIMSKRTAGEYKASAYKDGITAYWDGDSKIVAVMAESGTEGSQYARSYFYDDNGNLFYADLSGKDSYRLYFKDGKLIRLSYAKDASNTADVTNYDQADSQEYTDWESSALEYSTTLMTEAKAAGIVKSQEEIDAEKAAEEERQKEEEEARKKEEAAKQAEEAKQQAEEKEEEESSSSSSGKSSEYIFPDSNSEYLSTSDLKGLSQTKVRRALNEIYARRGAKFDTSANKKYFESKSWYKGTCSKADAQKKFNKYEKTNVDLIVEYEKSKGWR